MPHQLVDIVQELYTGTACHVRTADDASDLVQELDRYDIREAALQETEWYENAVYHAGESVLLTAGCATLASGEEMQREKGMAIVLSGPAIAA